MDPHQHQLKKQLEDPLRYLRISNISSFSPGDMIYRPGQPATHIYLVMSGAVKVTRTAGRGRESVTSVYRSDAVFGEAAFIQSYRSDSAAALEETKLMAWTTEQIEAVGRETPKLLYALLQIMVGRVGTFEGRIESFVVDDARRRLVRALIDFSKDKDGETLASPAWMAPLTHELLASYIGATREAVTQFMNLLRRQGYLNYSRKGILVFPERLEELLREEDAPLALPRNPAAVNGVRAHGRHAAGAVDGADLSVP